MSDLEFFRAALVQAVKAYRGRCDMPPPDFVERWEETKRMREELILAALVYVSQLEIEGVADERAR